MLDLAYRCLSWRSDSVCEIGPVSDAPDGEYLWHYWMPWLAMLDRGSLRLRLLDELLGEGRPFAYPLELRWEFLEWASRKSGAELLSPHVPREVLNAARLGKAAILLFFGHEARPLRLVGRASEQCAYDLIFSFVRRHSLSPGAVSFINGNLAGQPELERWKGRRFGNIHAPEPFEVRFVEPFSYLAQATQRLEDQGLDVAVEPEGRMNPNGSFTHRSLRLTLGSAAQGPDAAGHAQAHSADERPRKLFLCMNRRPRRHRRVIVCHLLRRNLLEHSLVSYPNDNPKPVQGESAETTTAWEELRGRLPLAIDRDLPLDAEAYFQDNCSAVKFGERWPYRDSCLSIVTETHFTSDRLFVSEKVWKPIRNFHPFIVAGTPGTLGYLRSLGFRTFGSVLDERYDSLADDERRMQALLGVIDHLGALDQARRMAMLDQVRPIVMHNERNLRQMRPPFAKVLAELGRSIGAGN